MRLRNYFIIICCNLLLITTAFAQDRFSCSVEASSIQLNEHNIYYQQTSELSSNGVILLIHGLFSSKNDWNQIFCQLTEDGYTVIAPDLPGYGGSQGFPLNDYQLEKQVKLLHQFITQLGINQPIHIAGNSMGGAIAALYADKYTDRVSTLAFFGSPLGIVPFSQTVKKAIYSGINPLIPINRNQFNLEMNLLFANPPELDWQTVDNKVLDYRTHNRNYVQIWNIVNLDNGVLAHRDVHFKNPVFIAWGKEDKIFDVSGATILANQYAERSNITMITLDNAGHLPESDRPEKLVSEYLHFLNSQS